MGYDFPDKGGRMPRKKKTDLIQAGDEASLQQVKYRKSNRLINARGKSTALVQKLFTVGITEAKADADGNIVACVPGAELRRIFGNYTGSFYETVKVACDSGDLHKPDLLSWRLRVEDKKKGTFVSTNVVSQASFDGKNLRIKFNPDIKNDIYNLSSQYTELYQYVVIKMKSPYSMQLYERFQSEMDFQRAVRHDDVGPYQITYTIEEIRDIFSLDYDALEGGRMRSHHLYKGFSDFRKHVLDVAKEEINAISPINMDYEPVQSGRGGKVISIRFTVSRKEAQKKKALSPDEILQRKIVFADAAAILAKTLDVEDIQAVCNAADYDIEKIKVAYELYRQASNVKNPTGWMIQAIKEGYKELQPEEKTEKSNKKTSKGTKKSKQSEKLKDYQKFEKTEYDMEALEKALLEQ